MYPTSVYELKNRQLIEINDYKYEGGKNAVYEFCCKDKVALFYLRTFAGRQWMPNNIRIFAQKIRQFISIFFKQSYLYFWLMFLRILMALSVDQFFFYDKFCPCLLKLGVYFAFLRIFIDKISCLSYRYSK